MFSVRNLSVLSYAQGFTLWHYRADPPASCEAGRDDPAAPGFFAEAAEMFAPGDMILLSRPGAGAVLFVAATTPTLAVIPLARTAGETTARTA